MKSIDSSVVNELNDLLYSKERPIKKIILYMINLELINMLFSSLFAYGIGVGDFNTIYRFINLGSIGFFVVFFVGCLIISREHRIIIGVIALVA